VFYFHGFPGSGVEARWGQGAAMSSGVRLIGLDRPGFGCSSFAPHRTILGLADDVVALADALDISHFSVLGMSGGAPYALACAARLPERILSTMILSGLGPMPKGGIESGMTPFNRVGLWLARRKWAGWSLSVAQPVVGHVLRRHPGRVVANLARVGGPQDREALEALGVGLVLEESFRCAVRAGARGMVAEAKLFARFTGDWLHRVRAPVDWYHGERDAIVPLVMARRAEAAMPQCRLMVHPDEGHFSVLAHHLLPLFDTIVRR